MQNKTPQIVIDFSKLAGHSRKVLNYNVQKNLIKIGYKWPDGSGEPKHIDQIGLVFNDEDAPRTLFYIRNDESMLELGDNVQVIDATTGLDGLFDMAEKTFKEISNVDNIKTVQTQDDKLGTVHACQIEGQTLVLTKNAIAGLVQGNNRKVDSVLDTAKALHKRLFPTSNLAHDGVALTAELNGKVGI